MKKILFLILSAFVFIGMTADIYVKDAETGESIPFVIINTEHVRKQVMTPFAADSGSVLLIEAMGYKPVRIIAGIDDTVFMKPSYTQLDTVNVVSELSPVSSNIEQPVNIVKDMLELAPVADVKRYSRTASVSIEGGSPEQVLVSINGFPIINPASGNIDPDMMGSVRIEQLNASVNRTFTGMGASSFSGNVDYIMYEGSRIRLLMNNLTPSFGIMYSFMGAGVSLERIRYNDMILPDNIVLENSHKTADIMSISLNNEYVNLLYMRSSLTAGDPGLEGSRFYDARLKQGMNLINAMIRPYYNSRILMSYSGFSYTYDNDELSIASHDYTHSKHLTASYEHIIYNSLAGINVSYANASGSRIGMHDAYNADAYANVELNDLFIQVKASLPIAGEFGVIYRKAVEGWGYETGMKYVSRRPTFNELYWQDAYTEGNEGLDDEHMYSAYYSRFYAPGILRICLTSGINVITNQIEWAPEGNIWTAVNNARVLNPHIGMEAGADAGIFHAEGFIKASPYFLDNAGDYHILLDDMHAGVYPYIGDLYSIQRYRPLLTAGLSLDAVYKGFTMHTGLQYKSIRYITNANTTFLPDYFIVNTMGLSYRYDKWHASLSVYNPFDIYIEDIRGYPVEGRNIQLSVTLEVK